MRNETCTYFADLAGNLKESLEFPVDPAHTDIVPDFFGAEAQVLILGAADYKTTITTETAEPEPTK